ncbi:hypothetical protein CF319_g2673 [Tilletia indica]|nr:hypothetical protein CF319_g2673 [Tilletia indica]
MRPFHPLPARPATSSAPLPPHPNQHPQNSPANRGGRGRGRGRGRGGQGHSQHFHGSRGAQGQDGRNYGTDDQGQPPRRQQHPLPQSSSSSYSSPARAQPTTDGPPDATIQGLNIRLDHPLLIEHWIAERKKRWPTKAVIEQKERDAIWRLPGSSSAERSRKRKRNEDAGAEDDGGKGKGRATVKAKVGGEGDDSASSSSEDDDDESSSSDSGSSVDEEEEVGNVQAKEDDEGEAEVEGAGDAETKEEEKAVNEEQESVLVKDPEGEIVAEDTAVKDAPTASSSSNFQHRQSTQHQQQQQPRKIRPKPRGPPSNPFARPSSSLLHALLRRETASHTNAVLQFFRFLVLNSFLVGVELKRGDAEEALRRANLIVNVADAEGKGKAPASQAVPKRIELKPLSSLAYPPAPDPLTFLDPLRSLDPFPLTHEQLIACCEDDVIREIIAQCTFHKAQLEGTGKRENGLTTAIRTLDELPTESHRTAALELILHIIADNPSNSQHHQNHLGAVWQPPPTSLSNNQMRPISETELFRFGLRVGFREQDDIRRIAERVSVLLEQVPVHAALPDDLKKAVGLVDDEERSGSSSRAAGPAKTVPAAMGAGIYEARGVGWQQLEWEREWERRETLKRLGLRLE